MSFLDLAKKRYSCRKYKEQDISKEKLLKVIEAGRVAPSAVNKQPWQFVIITENDLLDKIKSCYAKDWIQSAPAIIVICGDHDISWKRDDGKDHCDIDVAITTDHMALAATDNGLATCWVCKFNAKKCAEILNLPDNMEPTVLLPIGYPDDLKDKDRHDSDRKNQNEIYYWNGTN